MSVNFNQNNSHIHSEAAQSAAVWNLLKKEEKKTNKKISSAIRKYHLAHEAVKKEIAAALSEPIGQKIRPESEMVENAIISMSFARIFENRDGEIALNPELRQELQRHDSESKEAHHAVAHHLSRGSEQEVPETANVVERDIDEISIRTIENPNLLYS